MLVDQGSAVEIMYSDLYKGLNLKSKDLTAYESPLVSFDGKTVISKGQIRLPIQTDSEVVEVDFIVVDYYSPYIPIAARFQVGVQLPPHEKQALIEFLRKNVDLFS